MRQNDEDGMGFSGLVASREDKIEEARIKQAVQFERERCAKIAEAHKGSAAKKRIARGQKLSTMDPDVQHCIEDEERGEDIAAEMIAKAIRARSGTRD